MVPLPLKLELQRIFCIAGLPLDLLRSPCGHRASWFLQTAEKNQTHERKLNIPEFVHWHAAEKEDPTVPSLDRSERLTVAGLMGLY